MADTIRVTTSNIVVLETDAPVGDGYLRVTRASFVLLTGVDDQNFSLPTGRKNTTML